MASSNNYIYSVLFDLDGVLIDTESIYTDFWNAVDELYPTGVADFAHVIKGNTLPHILQTYFPDTEIQSKIRVLLKKQENEMIYRAFDGARDLLSGLRAAGIGVAVVTSSNRAKMSHLFEALPWLENSIDTLITDEDVVESKPAPEGYLLAASRLGSAPKNCLVVEDSIAGLTAGRRAGAKVAAIATTNPAEVVAPLADMTFDTVAQLSPQLATEIITKN